MVLRRPPLFDGGAELHLRRRVTVQLDDEAPTVVFEGDEVELLELAAEGLAPAAIGRRMGVNERTVRRRLKQLCGRIGVSTTVEAVVWAVRHEVI